MTPILAELSPRDCLPIDLPGCRVVLEVLIPTVVPDAVDSAFGTLIFTPEGSLWHQDGDWSWLYTSTLDEGGRWISQVREFNTGNFQSGSPKTVLDVSAPDLWAVIHLVIRLHTDLYLAFYSAGRGLRAAYAPRPDAVFQRIENFHLSPAEAWERQGGEAHIGSCEANGCFEPIALSPQRFTFWLGYDSYHADQGAGQLGWAKLTWDSRSKTLHLDERHPRNPLPFQPENWHAARCGGNLARGVLIGQHRPFFYYTRPTRSVCLLSLALARENDPFFLEPIWHGPIDKPLAGEVLVEKFETWQAGQTLHLIYESRHTNGRWHTGYRRYAILPVDTSDTALRIARAGATSLTLS